MWNSTNKTTSSLKWWIIVLIIVGCIVLWILGIWAAHCLAPKLSIGANYNEVGILGDSAGAINALFSAFAFAGMVIAIFLQKKELELQRDELKATNEQLKAQKEEFQTQNETLKRQRFENTFFQMMSLQQEIVNGLSFSYNESQTTKTQDGDGEISRNFLRNAERENSTKTSTTYITQTLRGRDVFYWIFERERIYVRIDNEKTRVGFKRLIELNGINAYDNLEYPKYFDHHFRHLYRIIKFIDESKLIDKEDDKYEYIGMVRGTLSRYEMVWLFYNCLSQNGISKFKFLVEKYALLKNLRDELLADIKHKTLYNEGAFRYTHRQ